MKDLVPFIIVFALSFLLCCHNALVEVQAADDNRPTTNTPHCNTHPNVMVDLGISHECFETPGLVNKRCYYIFVPPCVSAAAADTKKVPLVFDMHCYGECPHKSVSYTGWKEKAEKECFVVVWPVGTLDPNMAQLSCFNFDGGIPFRNNLDQETSTKDCCCLTPYDGLPSPTKDTQDPTFLRNIVTRLVSGQQKQRQLQHDDDRPLYQIDPTRIYMAGHSNGCVASLAMAALHSDIVAAVCCHSGMMITDFAEDYSPVPTWLLHGGQDVNVPAAGGGFRNLMSLEYTRHYIADRNGCLPETTIKDVKGGDTDDNEVVGAVYSRRNCTNDATVEVVWLPESGHIPYYMYEPPPKTTRIDTTQLAWEFCSSHAKSEIPAVFQDKSDTVDTQHDEL